MSAPNAEATAKRKAASRLFHPPCALVLFKCLTLCSLHNGTSITSPVSIIPLYVIIRRSSDFPAATLFTTILLPRSSCLRIEKHEDDDLAH